MEVQTQYGSYTIGRPEHRGRGWYVRYDTYHCNQPDLNGQQDRVVCLHKEDLTTIYHGYNGQCGYCWLNHGHTEAVHENTLAQGAQQREERK